MVFVVVLVIMWWCCWLWWFGELACCSDVGCNRISVWGRGIITRSVLT